MGNTRPAIAQQAPDFLTFAEELMDGASYCRSTGRRRSAALLAIHASIAAADAVCVAFLGERASSEQHSDAADLLAASGAPEARAKATQFSAIIEMKNRVAYEARPPTHGEADILVKRAERFVDWAARVVRGSRRAS
jgi:HEPN domain-containing protein